MQRQVAPGPWPLSHTVRLYVRKLVYCLIKGRLKRNVRPKGHTRTFGLRCVCTHTYRGVGEGGGGGSGGGGGGGSGSGGDGSLISF